MRVEGNLRAVAVGAKAHDALAVCGAQVPDAHRAVEPRRRKEILLGRHLERGHAVRVRPEATQISIIVQGQVPDGVAARETEIWHGGKRTGWHTGSSVWLALASRHGAAADRQWTEVDSGAAAAERERQAIESGSPGQRMVDLCILNGGSDDHGHGIVREAGMRGAELLRVRHASRSRRGGLREADAAVIAAGQEQLSILGKVESVDGSRVPLQHGGNAGMPATRSRVGPAEKNESADRARAGRIEQAHLMDVKGRVVSPRRRCEVASPEFAGVNSELAPPSPPNTNDHSNKDKRGPNTGQSDVTK